MIIPCDQAKVSPATVVCGSGGTAVVSKGEPSGVEDDRSVRTSFAKRTAPSTFNSPAPCSNMLKPASGCAVYIKIILTMFGVSFGLSWSKRAAAPAAQGAGIEVPLRDIILLLSTGLTQPSTHG